jgi:hypothetical protein
MFIYLIALVHTLKFRAIGVLNEVDTFKSSSILIYQLSKAKHDRVKLNG